MTTEQQALIDHLTATLAKDGRVRSAWLSGSLGQGAGDRWSDVDITVVVDQADLAACIADFQAPGADLPQVVFAQLVHGRIISAITPDWERFDLSFLTPAEFARQDGASLKPLLGDTASPPPPRDHDADNGAAFRVSAMAHEFIRVLGLSPGVFGRGEWLVGQQGVELLRKMLVDLMLEENGVPPGARGMKRLNGFLTLDQITILEGLDPPAASRESLLAANAELAWLFFARAKPLAERLGVAWPEAFEAATRRRLIATLDLEF